MKGRSDEKTRRENTVKLDLGELQKRPNIIDVQEIIFKYLHIAEQDILALKLCSCKRNCFIKLSLKEKVGHIVIVSNGEVSLVQVLSDIKC